VAAIFSAEVKEQFFERFPNLINDRRHRSSETGSNGLVMVMRGQTAMKGGPP